MTDLAQENTLICGLCSTISPFTGWLQGFGLGTLHVVTNAKVYSGAEHSSLPPLCFCVWLGYKQVATLTSSNLVELWSKDTACLLNEPVKTLNITLFFFCSVTARLVQDRLEHFFASH